MHRLVAEELGHRFAGEGAALFEGLALLAEAGEIVALIGLSGSGKSTLLRILGGLLAPSDGEIRLDGVSATAALRQRWVGMVWQEESLLPWLSALDNVALALRAGPTPMDRPSARAEAEKSLECVGLAEAKAKLPSQLSGGMRQRVALARALVTRPRLLLLDEPFSSLDDITREQLLEVVGKYSSESGACTVMATHNLMDAATLADKVVALSGRPAVPAMIWHDETRGGNDASRAKRYAEISRCLRMTAGEAGARSA